MSTFGNDEPVTNGVELETLTPDPSPLASQQGRGEKEMDKTIVAPAFGAEATLMGTTIKCPVCNTENAPGEKYCGECGFLLTSTPGESSDIETADHARLVDAADNKEHFLVQGENVVGREAADVLLADPTVSRRHALIVVDGSSCRIEDFGSTNGTYVAGKQIQPGDRVDLTDGVEIKIGSVRLTLSIPESSDAAESEEAMEKSEIRNPKSETGEGQDAEVFSTASVARLVSTKNEETVIEITPGTSTVGRRSNNDIVISDDQYVSGSHAELSADTQGRWLIDVGSTNGTLLNSVRVAPNQKMMLQDGDEITFGQSSFKFEVIEQPVVEETAEEETEE